jgi:membrane protease YdiL (CAAX protease family)
VIRTALIYAAYLLVPAILLLTSRRGSREPHPVAAAAAGVAFWLPIEFRLLPPLRVPVAGGYDVGPLVGVIAAFSLFLVARPLDGIGFTFRLTARDIATALAALAVYAVVAVPIGLATGFLEWNPRITPQRLLITPLLIYLLTALPEEFLFRGIFQNLLMRWLGQWPGLAVAAVIFGLAHLPDYRYVALATLAGVVYGFVYARTKKITASAVTHCGVNSIWAWLLRT